jgi:glycosyltransferase involved in cell wall biosynthesis
MDQKQPLVSVGILTYNRPNGLKNTLHQIVNQTYRNLEIIVSDNCSETPETGEVVREFMKKDDRITYFRQPVNITPLPNFKFTLEQASAEYFMWAADDDEWEPDFIEELMKPFFDDEQTVFSFCHIRNKDPRTEEIVDDGVSDNVGSDSRYMLVRAFKSIFFSASGAWVYGLVRRKYVGKWLYERRFGCDHLWLLSLTRYGKIHISRKVLYTNTLLGRGFHRDYFHHYYDRKIKKIGVNISSTIMWAYEFFVYAWTAGSYTFYERLCLSVFIVMRFLKPRYWRRFAGDIRALLFQPSIWEFKE